MSVILRWQTKATIVGIEITPEGPGVTLSIPRNPGPIVTFQSADFDLQIDSIQMVKFLATRFKSKFEIF